MKRIFFLHLLGSLLLLGTPVLARVGLSSVFSDNMMLQQKTNAAIWGTAKAGAAISVTTSWNKKVYNTIADAAGNWKVKVATPSFGGPYKLTINDGEETVLNNVLIGDVWICSGQSNMEMPLAGWGKINNYEQEIAAANYPNIRLLQVKHVTSKVPLNDVAVTNGGWTPCTPKTVAEFSSVAYFFAREIVKATGVPIGLIHTSWGGTIAEAWTSGPALKQLPDFAGAVSAIESEARRSTPQNFQQEMQDWFNQMPVKDRGNQNNFNWATDTGDEAEWKNMSLPTIWEDAGLQDLDGVVWFKKKVVVPESWAGKELKLNLGTIDDDDITWFNGTKVGATQGYNLPRSYTIPASLVKAGENIITVRVVDNTGSGGLYGDKTALNLSAGTNTISLAGSWLYRVGVNLTELGPRPVDENNPNRATVLYNAMIHPFIQFSIKGAIWYQGESNAGRAYQYRSLFPAMITDWRNAWGQGDFPFYFVQLANFMKPVNEPAASAWAELREAQHLTLSLPNTGMATAIDIGDAGDIHPKNKQEVGRRLALIALSNVYGKKIDYSGPLYQAMSKQGNSITLTFTNSRGLKANGEMLKGFAIAGADKKFYNAKATVSGNKVMVSSPQVAEPVAVRYDWADNPDGNLVNGSGLPAPPFRTDDWPGITVGKK